MVKKEKMQEKARRRYKPGVVYPPTCNHVHLNLHKGESIQEGRDRISAKLAQLNINRIKRRNLKPLP